MAVNKPLPNIGEVITKIDSDYQKKMEQINIEAMRNMQKSLTMFNRLDKTINEKLPDKIVDGLKGVVEQNKKILEEIRDSYGNTMTSAMMAAFKQLQSTNEKFADDPRREELFFYLLRHLQGSVDIDSDELVNLSKKDSDEAINKGMPAKRYLDMLEDKVNVPSDRILKIIPWQHFEKIGKEMEGLKQKIEKIDFRKISEFQQEQIFKEIRPIVDNIEKMTNKVSKDEEEARKIRELFLKDLFGLQRQHIEFLEDNLSALHENQKQGTSMFQKLYGFFVGKKQDEDREKQRRRDFSDAPDYLGASHASLSEFLDEKFLASKFERLIDKIFSKIGGFLNSSLHFVFKMIKENPVIAAALGAVAYYFKDEIVKLFTEDWDAKTIGEVMMAKLVDDPAVIGAVGGALVLGRFTHSSLGFVLGGILGAILGKKTASFFDSLAKGDFDSMKQAFAGTMLENMPAWLYGAMVGAGVGSLAGGPAAVLGAALGALIGLTVSNFFKLWDALEKGDDKKVAETIEGTIKAKIFAKIYEFLESLWKRLSFDLSGLTDNPIYQKILEFFGWKKEVKAPDISHLGDLSGFDAPSDNLKVDPAQKAFNDALKEPLLMSPVRSFGADVRTIELMAEANKQRAIDNIAKMATMMGGAGGGGGNNVMSTSSTVMSTQHSSMLMRPSPVDSRLPDIGTWGAP